jgi:Tol biopolymer transport system component
LLEGTEGAAALNPFWSPDSRSVGFFSQGKLKKVDLSSGTVQVLCDAPAGAGGTWGPDGTIVFAPNISGGLFRVSSAGGTPRPVTSLDAAKQERSHRAPWFLPDGRHFLFLSQGPPRINIGSIDGPDRIELTDTQSRALYADGHLLLVRDGTLLAQPFDPASLKTTGEPFPVAEDVSYAPVAGAASFTVSTTGVLGYRTGIRNQLSELVWFDRKGTRLGAIGQHVDQANVQLSADGSRVAVSEWDSARDSRDIAVHDLVAGSQRKITSSAADEFHVVWSPDGSEVIFNSDRQGQLDIYRKVVAGGTEELLLDDPKNNAYPMSWSSDGRYLLYQTGAVASPTNNDLWALPLFGERTPIPIAQTSAAEIGGQFSPDGRWIAYQLGEVGGTSVAVVPFPGPGGPVRVSTGNGTTPRWSRTGKELFYSTQAGLMVAEVNGDGPVFRVGAVRPLFDVARRTAAWRGWGPPFNWDVSADGQRFLVNTATETLQPSPATIITNWTASVRR